MPLQYTIDDYVSGGDFYVTEDHGADYIAEPGTPIIPADELVYYVFQFDSWLQYQLDLVLPPYHPAEVLLYIAPTTALIGYPPTGPIGPVQVIVVQQGPADSTVFYVDETRTVPYVTEDRLNGYIAEVCFTDFYSTEDGSSLYVTEDGLSDYRLEGIVVLGEQPLFWNAHLILAFDLNQNPNTLVSQFTVAQVNALALTWSNFAGGFQPGMLRFQPPPPP